MNLGELVSWGQRTLRYLTRPGVASAAVMPNRLEANWDGCENTASVDKWADAGVVEKTLE